MPNARKVVTSGALLVAGALGGQAGSELLASPKWVLVELGGSDVSFDLSLSQVAESLQPGCEIVDGRFRTYVIKNNGVPERRSEISTLRCAVPLQPDDVPAGAMVVEEPLPLVRQR